HMFETVCKQFGSKDSIFVGEIASDSSWTLNYEKAIQALNLPKRGQPLHILGTAFSFVHLLDYFQSRNLHFKLPTGSKIMETGGYKGRSRTIPKPELHRQIAKSFSLVESDIVTEYGMSELSSQAYAREDEPFRFPPWARARVISPETGNEVEDGESG